MLNRKNQSNQDQSKQNPNPDQKQMEELAALKAQVSVLQEQLQLQKNDEESLKMQAEAARLQKNQEALEQEADLRRTLSDAFSPSKIGLKPGEELEQSQLVTVLAEAVGAASDAQAKLILSKVNEMAKSQDEKIKGAHKAIVELATMLSVNQARNRFADFDDRKTEIAKILSETRGLSPEDAYLLAKARLEVGNPSSSQLDSEKPNEAPGRSGFGGKSEKSSEETESFVSPRQVFRTALSKAIDKALQSRQMKG